MATFRVYENFGTPQEADRRCRSYLQSRTESDTRVQLLSSKMNSLSIANPSVARAVLGPVLDVVIEVPRGSFVKRGSSGSIDFI